MKTASEIKVGETVRFPTLDGFAVGVVVRVLKRELEIASTYFVPQKTSRVMTRVCELVSK